MPASSHWVTGLRFCFAVAAGCAVALTGVAWYRGAIDPLKSLTIGDPAATATNSAFAPEETVEAELDPEWIEAQSEPAGIDEERPEPDGMADVARRDPSGRGIARLDDATDDEFGGTVATANFEEILETPPSPAPDSPRATEPARDRVASSRGRTGTERSASPPVAADSGALNGGALMALDRIDALETAGDLVAAQRELSRWYWQKPGEREPILPRLNRMARALYFSPQPHYYEPYVVQPGDQLRVIGQKHKLSWEYLSRLNHVDARKIRAGQKLKVVTGPFAAHVSLGRYELVIHLDGSFVKSYRVGVGKDGTTPVGTFAVKNKMIDPTYYGPEGVIAHDDPQNPLGERWIDIGDSYGIHGTIEPGSIGKSESRGCIRMLNSEVEEVYDFLVNGSEVRIER